MIAYTFYKDSVGDLDELIEALKSDFMQTITGYLIGIAESASEFIERETAVKATADWLAHREGFRFP
jgi:hypothetical protein